MTRKSLNVGLWIVQSLLFVVFVGTAVWKVATPLPELAAMIPWAGQVSRPFFYFTAAADFAGGLGVLLPSLTRIKPSLAVLASLGCATLQISAVIFHVSRGEAANTPFNFLLVLLAGFVAWGRRKVPISPRS